MKTRYERMNRVEKKELYNEYKIEKQEFTRKMEKMFILCYLGVSYGIIMFIYDFFYKKSMVGYILDLIVFVFCLLALYKVINIKKDLLNKFALEKDNMRKKEVIKKYNK